MKSVLILKDKRILFIIMLILLLLTLAGVTYSYLQTEEKSTTFRGTTCFNISYTKGQDINAELTPGATYDSGHSTDVIMYAKASCDNVVLGKLYITTNATSTMDLSDGALKYAVSVNGEIVSEGTVNGTTNQLIYNDFTLNKTSTTYKVYVWLDQTLEDTTNVSEEVYSGFIHAEAIAESTVGPLKVIASEVLTTLASADACAAGGKGICATNSYTKDDGTTAYHDYRYRGAEVDNYVWFNNDMYRIIGVFDENSHGVEGKQLVKLIAANPLMATAWGAYNSSATSGTYSNYSNDWTGNTTGVKANANVLLNEYFYGKTNTSNTYGTCSTWTYYYNSTSYRTNDCSDIVGYGINNTSKSYIEEVTWYLTGYNSGNYSKQDFYLCERGQSTDTTNCMSGNSGAYDTSTMAHIGLMYPSDFLYASSYYIIADTTIGDDYHHGINNWLFNGSEWTITPALNDEEGAFQTGSLGYIDTLYSRYGNVIRPSFYLKSNIAITGGNGSFANPFTLSLSL